VRGARAARTVLALMMPYSFALGADCPEKITSEEVIARKFKLEMLGLSTYQKIDGGVETLVFSKENCRCGFAAPPNNGITEMDIKGIRDYRTLALFLTKFRISEGICPPTEEMNANAPFAYCFRKAGEKCGK
jgi:hypothetical protein